MKSTAMKIGTAMGYATIVAVLLAISPVLLALAIISTVIKAIIGGPAAIKDE